MTDPGVEVDACPACDGVWLDRGEIFSFTMDTAALQRSLADARRTARPGTLRSPATGGPMNVLRLMGGQLEIDECPKTGGQWLDRGELERIGRLAGVRVLLDRRSPAVIGKAAAGTLRPLPNLFLRSGALAIALYGMLVGILIAAVEAGWMLPEMALLIGLGIAAFQFAFSPWILDLSLAAFYRCRGVEADELPEHLRRFVERVCRENGMRFPRFKIIDDGAPNAFTYGHYPGNARIVITRGILELLEPWEVEAVVAHEIGHAVHWDMVLMTLAQVVPLVLYYVYRALIRVKVRGRDKSAGQRIAVAVAAYVLYVVSQYLVLWFSRVREYHADRFAGNATGDPNALASALVKIAYGLAASPQPEGKERREVEAVGALGIFDARAGRTLAIAGGVATGAATIDPSRLENAMKWDLWNPWAKYYEIHSTHPLVANRLSRLGEQAAWMGREPFAVFSARKPESYWDEFFADLFVMWLPWIVFLAGGAAAAATGHAWALGLAVTAAGMAYLMKIRFSYPSQDFPPMSVAALLKQVKVSAVRGVPCELQGRIIGRGVPGLIWSEDFVMQDDTGIVFLDYRQPMRIWEFFYGLMRAGQWQGRQVTVTGWYRRSPVPYVELRTIETAGDSSTCYVLWLKRLTALALVAGGIVLALGML